MTTSRMAKLSGKLAQRSKAAAGEGVVLPPVRTQMLKDFEAGEDRRWDIVHPSELSHQDRFCGRAVYLRITEGPVSNEKYDFVRENIFAEGNAIHAKWQDRLRRSVPLWGDWKCVICAHVEHDSLEPDDPYCNYTPACYSSHGHIWEYVEVNLDAEAEAMMCGHADGAFGNSLVEFKSVGEGTVRIEAPDLHRRHQTEHGTDLNGLWKDIRRPFKTHLNQGDIYLWICKQRGLPFNQISYVYESKWNQQVKEYVIEYSEERSLKLVAYAEAVMYSVNCKEEPACRFPGKCAECKPYDARRAAARQPRTVEIRA